MDPAGAALLLPHGWRDGDDGGADAQLRRASGAAVGVAQASAVPALGALRRMVGAPPPLPPQHLVGHRPARPLLRLPRNGVRLRGVCPTHPPLRGLRHPLHRSDRFPPDCPAAVPAAYEGQPRHVSLRCLGRMYLLVLCLSVPSVASLSGEAGVGGAAEEADEGHHPDVAGSELENIAVMTAGCLRCDVLRTSCCTPEWSARFAYASLSGMADQEGRGAVVWTTRQLSATDTL